MLFPSIAEYHDIIDIKHNKAMATVLQHTIHQRLEESRSITKAHGHPKVLKLVIFRVERDFLDIRETQGDLMRASLEIQLGKEASFTRPVKCIISLRQRGIVAISYRIKTTIVHYTS